MPESLSLSLSLSPFLSPSPSLIVYMLHDICKHCTNVSYHCLFHDMFKPDRVFRDRPRGNARTCPLAHFTWSSARMRPPPQHRLAPLQIPLFHILSHNISLVHTSLSLSLYVCIINTPSSNAPPRAPRMASESERMTKPKANTPG